MQKTYVVLLTGGTGTRIGKELPKQFLNIAGKPIIIHTLEKFSGMNITGIIIVIAEGYTKKIKNLVKEYSIPSIIKIINGGTTRQGSSYNAITCMEFDENDILIFHDAARPFICRDIIKSCMEETANSGACGVYINATDTIAVAEEGYILEVPSRENMYYAQTPQCFKYGIIRKAHDIAISKGINNATDDVTLVKDSGNKVKIINGNSRNIKITNPFDISLAEFILSDNDKRK